MGLKGTLSKQNLGFSMPSDAPLYPKPPYIYKGASMMVFNYLTDGDSAASLLPEQAELADPPTAGLVFATYPESTLGPYSEVVLFLDAVYKEKNVKYGAYLYVTTDVAMAAGREMGGFPKKIAAIEISGDPDFRATLERPAGLLLASGSMKVAEKTRWALLPHLRLPHLAGDPQPDEGCTHHPWPSCSRPSGSSRTARCGRATALARSPATRKSTRCTGSRW